MSNNKRSALSSASFDHMVNRATKAMNGDFGPDGQKRFETTFADELAQLVPVHGFTGVLEWLFECAEHAQLPCSLSFLGRYEPRTFETYPNDEMDNWPRNIDDLVDWAVMDSPIVEDLTIYFESDEIEAGSSSSECRIELIDGIYAVLPEWEKVKVLERLQGWIESTRQAHIDDERAHVTEVMERLERSIEERDGPVLNSPLDDEEFEVLKNFPAEGWEYFFGTAKPEGEDELKEYFTKEDPNAAFRFASRRIIVESSQR